MKETSIIHSDPNILGGTPVFVGTRVPVQALIGYIEGVGRISRRRNPPPSRQTDGGLRCANPPYALSINFKTAKALRLTVPNSMQLLADEVIEKSFRTASIYGGEVTLWVTNCRAYPGLASGLVQIAASRNPVGTQMERRTHEPRHCAIGS